MRGIYVAGILLVIIIWLVMGRDHLAPTFFGHKNNSMNVIWHNDERACFHIWKMVGNIVPPFLNDFAVIAQIHFCVDNLSKQTFAPLRHNCDIIRTL